MQEVKVLEFLQDNTKNKPNEDFLLVSQSEDYLICAVADGVTRYVPKGASYPDPSHARDAAEEFCRTSVSSVKKSMEKWDDLRDAFLGENEAIARMNRNLGVTKETCDYLGNDFFGCQGVLGVWVPAYEYKADSNYDSDWSYPDRLVYGYIADCGLLVFDKDLFPVSLSENSVDTLERFREGWDFSSKEEERKIFWTKTMRNRPLARHLTYGSLTGESGALAYLRTGALYLQPGDTAVFFSDGILPFVYSRDFRKVVRDQIQNDSKKEAHGKVAHCIAILTEELGAKHVSNLDDDKAFVAFSVLS